MYMTGQDTIDSSQKSFKYHFRRLMRQLNERERKVENRQKPESYYQNKRREFRKLIDNAIRQGWFKMPGKETRIYRIYHDV